MSCVACGAALDSPDTTSFRKDGFELVRCGTCGLVARRRLPTENELPGLYSPEYFHDEAGETGGYADYLADESLHRDLARRRLARMPAPRQGDRLLDVGAAAGFFVAEAVRRGWDAEGVDISRSMVDHARGVVGVRVTLGGVMDVGDGQFDAITMWDYLEHSVQPANDLERSAALLRPGGVLALSTGDIDSLVARLTRSHWHLLTPRHHNYFFSEKTIRMMLGRAGFEVVAIHHPGARYSISHLVYKLGRHVPGSMSTRISRRAAQSRIGQASMPVNLHDIISVLAVRS